jgi:hypothetical protein
MLALAAHRNGSIHNPPQVTRHIHRKGEELGARLEIQGALRKKRPARAMMEVVVGEGWG